MHLGFYIPAAYKKADGDSAREGRVSEEAGEALLIGSQFYFALGIRAFYAFVPIVLWAVAGVIPLFLGSLALVLLDYIMDSAHDLSIHCGSGGLRLHVRNHATSDVDEERPMMLESFRGGSGTAGQAAAGPGSGAADGNRHPSSVREATVASITGPPGAMTVSAASGGSSAGWLRSDLEMPVRSRATTPGAAPPPLQVIGRS